MEMAGGRTPNIVALTGTIFGPDFLHAGSIQCTEIVKNYHFYILSMCFIKNGIESQCEWLDAGHQILEN